MNDYAVRLLLLLPPTTADTHTFEQHALVETCEKRESVSVTVSYYAVFIPSPRLFPNKNDFLILMINDKNRQQFDIIRPCWLRTSEKGIDAIGPPRISRTRRIIYDGVVARAAMMMKCAPTGQ